MLAREFICKILQSGEQTSREADEHISVLEIRAGQASPYIFPRKNSGAHPCSHDRQCLGDSLSEEQGRMAPMALYQMTEKRLTWSKDHAMMLLASHIARKMNILADWLKFYNYVVHTEWSLAPRAFRAIH